MLAIVKKIRARGRYLFLKNIRIAVGKASTIREKESKFDSVKA
jgi:hypothetical protein